MSATPLTAQQADAILAPFIVMGRSHSWLRFKTIEAWVHHDLAAGLLLMIERGLVASTYTLYRHGGADVPAERFAPRRNGDSASYRRSALSTRISSQLGGIHDIYETD